MIIQDTLFKNISNVLFVLICPSPTHIPLSVGLMWMDPLCFLQVGGCAQAAGPAEAACEGSIRGNKEEGKGGAQRYSAHPRSVPDSLSLSLQLCFALSILGNPSVVLLDEPSTGMDPEGQLQMW